MNSLDDISDLMTLLGLVILVGFCVALFVVITVTAISLIIYVIIECLLRPFFGKCLDIDLEIGQRARIVTYRAIIPTDMRLPLEILDSRDLHDPRREKRGLGQNTIETLLPKLLVRGFEGRSSTYEECAICLSDYGVHEECRIFPVCRHMYHAHCIDAWLKNHLTCPTCRKELLDS
ncbi:PREDICTED: putative RING-H2 finger protein ATL19 [Tarenaya hassleriana]|uniref:putative RING-H2 finger protein ATL19 n=1 Tax=Tarenaya hassleriana TaxID=28532 RepID=UPI00053C8F61|nr:PREDICTED: putative RING-H2 finger protein ATL19 [Tarenaya hassleriana]